MVRIENTEEETRGLEGMIQVTAQQLSNGPCYPVIIWMASTQNPSENAGATLRVYNQHLEKLRTWQIALIISTPVR